VQVIVTAVAGKYTPLRARLLGSGKKIKAEHKFINAITAEVQKSDVRMLETDSSAAHISLDFPVESTAAPGGPPSQAGQPGPLAQAGQPAVRAVDDVLLATLGLTNQLGTGKGVGVAVLDSGLQPSADLPPFAFFDLIATSSGSAYDDYGHGTHVAGLIRAAGSA